MKIERVNDRQIRCTLTGADLAVRQLKISELAYGSEKAKSLFRDMMRQQEMTTTMAQLVIRHSWQQGLYLPLLKQLLEQFCQRGRVGREHGLTALYSACIQRYSRIELM